MTEKQRTSCPDPWRRVSTEPVSDRRNRIDGGLEHIDRADELADEPRARSLVDVGRAAHLLDAAAVHDDDAIGERHALGLIVRHEHHGDARLLLEVLELGAHVDPQLGVQIAERLVQEQQLRLEDHGPGERDALLLATRKLRSPARFS